MEAQVEVVGPLSLYSYKTTQIRLIFDSQEQIGVAQQDATELVQNDTSQAHLYRTTQTRLTCTERHKPDSTVQNDTCQTQL